MVIHRHLKKSILARFARDFSSQRLSHVSRCHSKRAGHNSSFPEDIFFDQNLQRFRDCQAATKCLHSAPVLPNPFRLKIILGVLACLPALFCTAEDVVPNPVEVVISVADQRMALLRDGGVVAKYPISTSKFGVGDSFGSYKTPLGLLKICDKVGEDCASGTVIKHREPTNEILPVNAAGRDPIVTRILWLEVQEDQNRNARSRGIYIHGTPEEKRIGDPVSWGCIRMRVAAARTGSRTRVSDPTGDTAPWSRATSPGSPLQRAVAVLRCPAMGR